MTIKSILTFGCWMLLASALLSNPAFADPPGIDPDLLSGSGGNSGVISVNAPPQPLEPGRTKFLPPQPEGVINLNAPSQQNRRNGALLEFTMKNCTPGTPGCPPRSVDLPSFQRTQIRMDLPHFSMSSMSSGIGGAAGRIR
jgi:hypothetical protein